MNGAMILAVDSGYGNIKTAITRYESEPVLSRDYTEYNGSYHVVGKAEKALWRTSRQIMIISC